MEKLKDALFRAVKDNRTRAQETVHEYGDDARTHAFPIPAISCLDPLEGTKFRGKTVSETLALLPKYPGREYPSVESFYWFLLTGEVPSEQEAGLLIEDFKRRRALPNYVVIVLRALPRDTHPMTMFSAAIFSMQQESVFVKKYNSGIKEDEYWDPMYEDCTNLLAKLPSIASYIYRMKYKADTHIPSNTALDFCGNLAWQMGMPERYDDAARMYFILHSDQEPGNAFPGATHLLSDPYYALCADFSGLAGPLRGLANQEALGWIVGLRSRMGGKVPTEEEMHALIRDTLKAGQDVPGYGHSVLRKTDPRYMAQREFCLKNLPDDPLFQYVDMLYKVVPSVLEEQGSSRNSWPNADAQSGVVQWHYGLTEWDFYTVLSGIGRAFGVLSNIVWDCALGCPTQRPRSFAARMLEELALNTAKSEGIPATSAAHSF